MSKSLRIGLAVSHTQAYYRRILLGIARYAQAKPNWLFASVILDEGLPPSRGLNRVDGLIASVQNVRDAKKLSRWRKPLVDVDCILSGLAYPRVNVDNFQVGHIAAAHFLECGLVHFGFVGPPQHRFSTERLDGFSRALKKAGYSVSCCLTPSELPFDPLGRRWDLGQGFHRWLRALPKPVGIFAPGDDWGIQVTEACRQVRVRVPEDVAVIGVDDDDLDCQFSRPQLTSVIVPAERIGYEAAEMLDRQFAKSKGAEKVVTLPPPGLMVRRSTEVLAIDDQEVVAAVRYIRENAHLPLRVSDVIERVAIGRRSLERRCQNLLGRSLGDEIRSAHFKLACQLLVMTELPMKLIAPKSGYSDTRHMDVQFQQQLGMSPTAYRCKMRGNRN